MKFPSLLVAALLFTAGVAAVSQPNSADAQQAFYTPEQVRDDLASAVPQILTPYGRGSGVLISPRRVLTNAHVVQPFGAATVEFPNGVTYYDIPVAAWDLMADMVVLELPTDAPFTPLPVVSDDGLPVGTLVYAIGYPGQADGSAPLTVLDGRISRLRDWPAPGVGYVQTDFSVGSGMSGGAVITTAGELIAFNEWIIEGGNSVGPSAVDVIARLELALAGQDIDQMGVRYPEAPAQPATSFDFGLLDGRDERVFVVPADANGPLVVNVAASEAAWVGAVWVDGTVITASVAETASDHVIELPETGVGVPFYVIVDQISDVPGEYQLNSSHSLTVLDDPDDRRVIDRSRLFFGHTDYPLDRDTFIVPLEAGQRLSVEVESLLVDQFASVESIQSGEIELLVWDDDSGGGVWSLDPFVEFVAPTSGDYFLVIGGLLDLGTGGYIGNVHISDSVGAIDGSFIGTLPPVGLALTSWGGGPIDDLVTAAGTAGCDLQSFWITADGVMVGYLVGAPPFVNGPILQRYPQDIPPRTPMLVSCGG